VFQRVEDATVSLGEAIVARDQGRADKRRVDQAWANASFAVGDAQSALDAMPGEALHPDLTDLFARYKVALDQFDRAFELWTAGDLENSLDAWDLTVSFLDDATDRAMRLRGQIRRA
jgi:hypothetical protein